MADLLLVVDMQNGFVNEKCQHIITNTIMLINAFERAAKSVVFTRFINHAGSGYEKLIGWSKLKEEPEINIIEPLMQYAKVVFDKTHYTPFIPAFKTFLRDNHIHRIFICGIATDSCVMKSAIDSFEHGHEPIVATNAVYSHAGEEAHQAGLLVISRNIGRRQLMETNEIIHHITFSTSD